MVEAIFTKGFLPKYHSVGQTSLVSYVISCVTPAHDLGFPYSPGKSPAG